MITLAAVLLLQASTPPTEQTFARARLALDRAMIDYPSARFRDVTATDSIICGSVNGPNRLGGYAGWHRFVVALTGPSEIVRFEHTDDLGLVRGLCDGAARPASTPDYSDRLSASARH